MRCSRGVLAGALIVLLAACGSNSPKSTTTPAAHASAQAATTAPDLNAELLSVSDLPAGWSVIPSTSSGSTEAECLKNAKTVVKGTSKADAQFAGGSNGLPLVDEALGYTPGQASKAMAAFSQVMAGCGHISVTSGGDTLTGTVGAMSFPAVADQSAAWQMNLSGTISGLSVTLGFDIVLFRRADSVGLIVYGDLGTPDILAVQTLVRDAAAKLQ